MSKLFALVAALALLVGAVTPAAACCIICVGSDPNEVCIPPGCDDEPVIRVTLPPEP